ncbi:MAG: GNAT family N-acetyltransferase [Caulobacteraceae bacterium]|nr:GNAT family N-acetyltransferase [Caulobacter sp.]
MPETPSPPRPDPASLVTLGRVVRGDAAELAAANLRNRGRHMPWIAPPVDEAGFVAWHQASLTGPHVNLIARETASGALVGVVSLENIVGGSFCCADLSYYGMGETGGRGLMTAAMRLALRHGFLQLGLHRLEAAVRPENGPSARLLKRLGFRLEGLSPEYIWVDGAWRDHERYALLRREFTG